MTVAAVTPPFVGRERELAQIGAALDGAGAGRGQLMMLAGEPGIGKTRLAAEFARVVHAEGATVTFGHADEETLLLPAAERVLADQLGELGAQMTKRRFQLAAPRSGEIAGSIRPRS